MTPTVGPGAKGPVRVHRVDAPRARAADPGFGGAVSSLSPSGNPVRLAVVSAADPVDRASGWLGEGLGCAVVADGEVRRGHGGIPREIAHRVTA